MLKLISGSDLAKKRREEIKEEVVEIIRISRMPASISVESG